MRIGGVIMEEKRCPFCQSKDVKITHTDTGYDHIVCANCKVKVNIHSNFTSQYQSMPIYQKAINIISEKLLREPIGPSSYYWNFYYDPNEADQVNNVQINLFTLLKNYPQSFMDILNRTLLNLAQKYPAFGEEFYVNVENVRLFYPANGSYDEAGGTLSMLVQMGYVNHIDQYHCFSISAEGWKKIESLQKNQNEIKQGFVAMEFGDRTLDIREAFRVAITSSGYSMRAIDEKEHNNQIVPEIFYEIERSKFVVVDVTYPNYGAYYEAGYAYGLGKEVIVCCSKEAFENKDGTHIRPHFDISQKSMVIWDNLDDLKVRLQRRIEATVR